jgi:hypothetical protein
VNVPNFGPGTEPGVLRRWAQTAEGLGFDLLAQLSLLGADTLVLDPFNGHPGETHHPEVAWQARATVSAGTRRPGEKP